MKKHQTYGASTNAVRTYSDGLKQRRPLSVPILQSVNFEAESTAKLGKDFRAGASEVYMRFGHPTAQAAGEKIALLEGAEGGLVFSSGMGAISTTLLALAGSSGGHVIAQREIFAQTFTFLDTTFRGLNIETTFVPADQILHIRPLLRPTTKLIYIESPSNPLLKIADIAAIARIAKEHNIPLLIDSTFASPALQNPISLGADVVLHSATKFLAGHSDVLCGAVVGSRQLIQKIQRMQVLLGTILDPHACWLLLRGIKTLGVRVREQSTSALALAQFLNEQAVVERVTYPFLQSGGSYKIASRQMRAGGGVVSFELKGGLPAAQKFVDALKLISTATSLGGVESVIEIPADLDFSEEDLGDAAKTTGIALGLIRLSVGIEDVADLMADIRQALASVASEGTQADKSLALTR